MWRSVLFALMIAQFLSIKPLYGQAYSYPEIPDTIVERLDREAYLAYHFWDNADFSDSTLLTSPKLILDYIYLLRLLPDNEQRNDCIQNGVSTYLSQSSGFAYLTFWLDRYLHNPQSPFYDDVMFLQFIEVFIEATTNRGQMNELMFLKEMTLRNQIGSIAEDFSFVLKNGTIKRLFEIESPLLLLIFNSPNCSLCHRLENSVSGNALFQQLISDNKLKIVSISPVADFDEWINHSYPANWICGFDKTSAILKERLYEIRQFPSMYLLDKDKHVIIKEANYEMLVSYLLQL